MSHERWLFSASSLGMRLGGMLVLALLPLGVLAIVQTRDAVQQTELMTLNGIGGASLSTVQAQIDLIREAQMTVRVQGAALSAVIPPDQECAARMSAIARTIPQATHLAFLDMSGHSRCSSTGNVEDFSDNPLFQRLIDKKEPRLGFSSKGQISGMPVISASYPVVGPGGRQSGVVVASVLYQAAKHKIYEGDYGNWTPLILATVTSDGTILASAQEEAEVQRLLPAGVTLTKLDDLAGKPFYDDSEGPNRRIISVVSVTAGLNLLAVWQREGGGWAHGALAPFLLPALTWAAALIAAALASGRLVVRHVRALSRSMSAYMRDRSHVPMLAMHEAPTEIRALHNVYQQLIGTIERDEAELQNLLVDKETLLREVHHRSGNSLQIIASVMRMYRRESSDPSLRAVLDGLVNRVMALSATHTSLYGLAGRSDVPMDEILDSVIQRLKQIHGIPQGTVKKRFESIRMPAQTAIPLALALAEAMGSLFTAPGLGAHGVEVNLIRDDNSIRLKLSGPAVPELMPETTRGIAALPRIMLRQYAAQLRGHLEIHIIEGRAVLELSIPDAWP